MGACDFENLVVIKGTANEAFAHARIEMNDENGHQDGCSGDIQTVHGFKMAWDCPKYNTKAFNKWVEEKTNELEKRDCLCVEIDSPSELKKLKDNRGLKGKKGIKAYYFFGVGVE